MTDKLFTKKEMLGVTLTMLTMLTVLAFMVVYFGKKRAALPKYDATQYKNELREWKAEQEGKVYER